MGAVFLGPCWWRNASASEDRFLNGGYCTHNWEVKCEPFTTKAEIMTSEFREQR
jgi:hypothetical protein